MVKKTIFVVAFHGFRYFSYRYVCLVLCVPLKVGFFSRQCVYLPDVSVVISGIGGGGGVEESQITQGCLEWRTFVLLIKSLDGCANSCLTNLAPTRLGAS